MKKKISQELKREFVNSSTGEITHQITETSSYVEREPDYVKIYIQDILKLKDLPKSSNSILLSILKRMGYNHQITLIAPIKRQIAEELSVELVTISKAIESFCKKDILIRQDRGLYIVNPYFFGRGKWEDIKKIRMTIEYSAKGRMFLRSQINDEVDQLEIFELESK